MILASKYPEKVDRLVVWGSNAFIIEEEAKIYESKYNVCKEFGNIQYINEDGQTR